MKKNVFKMHQRSRLVRNGFTECSRLVVSLSATYRPSPPDARTHLMPAFALKREKL
jgi:hypothetical protein